MTDTTFRFVKCKNGMQVTASYDTGWHEGLQCGGKGGWTDEVAFNEDDAAVFRMRNVRTGAKISICGMKWLRDMTFSVIFVSEVFDGFTVNEGEDYVEVTCYGPSSIEYTPVKLPATC